MKSMVGMWAGLLVLVAAQTAQAQVFNPYESLKEGDWVLYKSKPSPAMETEMRQRVVKVEGKKITIEYENKVLYNGKPMGNPSKTTTTIDLEGKSGFQPPKEGPGVKVEDKTLTVKGKELKCKVYTRETTVGEQKYVSEAWMCKDIPFGMVKVVTNGKVSMELADWGHGGSK